MPIKKQILKARFQRGRRHTFKLLLKRIYFYNRHVFTIIAYIADQAGK